MIYLDREEFLNEIKNFPKDFEKLCWLKDKIVLYDSFLGNKCEFCNNLNHDQYSCPYIHFNYPRSILFAKYNKYEENNR